MEVRWRTADGDKTRLSFEKYGSKYLLELASAAVVRDCVGDRIVELRHVSSECQGNGRKYLLKLSRSAVVWRCVGARLMEIRHVEVSRSMIGSTYWSWRAQLWCGTVLATEWWSYDTSRLSVREMVESTYWSWPGQLWCGTVLTRGWWRYDTSKGRRVL